MEIIANADRTRIAAPSVAFYIVGAAVLFTTYHFALMPLLEAVDRSALSFARGAIFEEIFKFVFIIIFLRNYLNWQQALVVGGGVGLAETIINTYAVFPDMAEGILRDANLSLFEAYLAIFVGIVLKLLFSAMGHFLTVYVALRLVKGDYIRAFFVSVSIHTVFNVVVSQF